MEEKDEKIPLLPPPNSQSDLGECKGKVAQCILAIPIRASARWMQCGASVGKNGLRMTRFESGEWRLES